MRWIVALGAALAVTPSLAFAQSPLGSAAPDFPGCEWRVAEEAGPSGRSALFCKTEIGVWRRINVDGLEPQTAAKAAGGDAHSMAILGAAYRRWSVRSPSDSTALLERGAAKGDPLAMRELGYAVGAQGIGPLVVPRGATEAEVEAAKRERLANETRAFSYFRQSAALGDVASMNMLAALLKYKNPDEANEWQRRGAEAGDPEAMVELARRLVAHDGKTGDSVVAEAWLRKAAATGHVAAMNILASNYRFGWMGMKADPAQAALWEGRADSAYVASLKDQLLRDGWDLEPSTFGRTEGPGSELAEIYFKGQRGVMSDPAEGVRLYEHAAEHGDERAALRLNSIYVEGASGIAADPGLAAKWEGVANGLALKSIIAGAKAGQADSMKRLAVLYITGQDGQDSSFSAPKDLVEGARWMRQAAEAAPDDPEIMDLLAQIYRDGLGVEKDTEVARNWQARAATIDPLRFGSLDDLIATLDQQPGFAAIMASRRLDEAGRPDDAVFWYYVGQLRGRMEAATDSTSAQAYGAIFATVGPGINEYAMANIPKFVAMVDKVLAWDEAHPMAGVRPAERVKQRNGLMDLRAHVLKDQDQIRRERTKNGLPNAPN